MPSSKPKTRPTGDDLDWLAFQYVSGELSSEECHDFENLLAEDQLARDSVVRAVELAQATALAFDASAAGQIELARQLATRRPLKSISRIVAIAAAACVALALIFVPQWPFIHENVPDNGEGSAQSEMHDLALAWASARDEMSREPRRTVEESSVAVAPATPAELVEVNEDIETPSWMLIAVAGALQDSQANEDAID